MAEAYYVDPNGLDSNSGSKDQPFKTISCARDHVRESGGLGKEPVTVYLREGTYYLDDTLVFTADDSGTPDAPVTYAAYEKEKVVVSGGSRLELEWEPHREGIFQAKTPEGLVVDELFVNGERRHMARYPNFDPKVLPYNGYAADAFAPDRAARCADPTGGDIPVVHVYHSGVDHYRTTG